MPIATLTQLLEKFVNERGSAAVMKEWKELITAEVEKVRAENEDLAAKNRQLEQCVSILESENRQLREQAAKKDEFIDFEGAAFKRTDDGKLQSGIYCPIHHVHAVSIDSAAPYLCPVKDCGWMSHITPGTLRQTILRATPGTLTNRFFD